MNQNSLNFGRSRQTAVLRLERLEDRRLLAAKAWSGYARDAQHSGQSVVAGQSLDVIHWETPVDSAPQYSDGELFIHYGSPVVTSANTIIVPEKNETLGGFDIHAFDGATGALKWTQTEGEAFVPPPHDCTPSYGPALAALASGPRLYFPGPTGTVLYRDSPDGNRPAPVGQIALYGNANYFANPSAYSGIRISSPLTADSQGNLYFTYQVTGSNPLGLHGGIARIGPTAAFNMPTSAPPRWIAHPP